MTHDDDLLGRLLAGQEPTPDRPGRAAGPDVSVRPAIPEDVAAIGDVHARTMRASLAAGLGADLSPQLRAAVDPADLGRVWEQAITAPPSPAHRVLTALAGAQVVGFAAIAPAEVPVPLAGDDAAAGPAADAPVGEILALEVPPAHGRSGHGSRLLAACVDLLREAGVTRVQTWTVREDESRTRFLSSAGFAPAGLRRTVEVDGAEVVEICWYADL